MRRLGIRRKGEASSWRSLSVTYWPTTQLLDQDISQPISPATMKVMAKYRWKQSWPSGAGSGSGRAVSSVCSTHCTWLCAQHPLHAAEVAPSCLQLLPSSPPLTTWGSREPLGEFSEGFVVRHFRDLEVCFQLTPKSCRRKKTLKTCQRAGAEVCSSLAHRLNYIWPSLNGITFC